MTQHKHAETLRAIADGAKCSDERPCIPCYTDQGHCEDEQPAIAHVNHDTEFYAIALQQAIAAHCRAEKVPQIVRERCPHHAAMLDKDLCSRLERAEKQPAGEIEGLRADADRWRWLVGGGIYDLPYKDHGSGPEFDLSPEAVDAAMQQKETK